MSADGGRLSEKGHTREIPTLAEFDMFAIDVTWDRPDLPNLIGPFARQDEAVTWGEINIPNGTWEVRPLAWPYYSSGRRHV